MLNVVGECHPAGADDEPPGGRARRQLQPNCDNTWHIGTTCWAQILTQSFASKRDSNNGQTNGADRPEQATGTAKGRTNLLLANKSPTGEKSQPTTISAASSGCAWAGD
ncbi:hypothetical protein AWZ03_000004 [Drosophila navojoa]|uniref:Uncharacterized protein n=1 Tax=Drosophila navojoa TaxID=7232 RepID=A0A484BWI7_DRONA|nr:hypothetical protein AWZ03_000004 [Drosophila navojoa]